MTGLTKINIPDNIRISQSSDNTETFIHIAPRKKNIYDYFFIFYVLFGLVFIIFAIISTIDLITVLASIAFLFLFGKLMFELILSLTETLTISLNREQLVIIRDRNKFTRKEQIYRASIKEIKLESLNIFGDFSSILLGFKNVTSLFTYKIPTILTSEGNILIAEHHNRNVRKWIVNYLRIKTTTNNGEHS